MAKRIISLDFLRGFSIICIAFFHLLLMTSELVDQASSDPFSLPIFFLALTVFTVVFAHWRGLFLIISSVVHIYTMTVAVRKGADRKQLWKTQVIFGLVLWVFGMFREVFLNEWSIPQSLATGESFADAFATYWKWIYLMEALENIAWGIIFNSTVFYFLTNNNGIEKIERNAWVFFGLSAFFIFAAPLVNQLAQSILGYNPSAIQPHRQHFLGWWDYPLRLFLGIFVTYNSPLFPMLGYTFGGAVFGLLLTRPKIPKTFLRNTALFSFALIPFGVFWLFFVQGFPENIGELIDFPYHPTWFVLIAMGMQMLFILLVMRLIEFNPNINMEKVMKITRMGRRWGIAALTIYSFLAIQHIIRAIMQLIFPQFDWRGYYGLPFEYSMILIVVVISVWHLITVLWEKKKFKYSLEWILTKAVKKNKPGKTIREDDLLDIEGVFYNPEFIMFVKPNKEQKYKYEVLGQQME
jgi:hypothetical protein